MTITALNTNVILLESSQAFKEQLINNLALAVAILNQGITSRTTTTPPSSPPDSAYIIPTGATGVWASKTNYIAQYLQGVMTLYAPYDGLIVWSIIDADWIYYHSGAWNLYGGGGGGGSLPTIANNTVLGNISGSPATPTALTTANLNTLLGLGNLATLGNIANNRVLGNASGGSANAIALTGSQLSTMMGLGPISALSNTGAVTGDVPTYQVGGTIAWASLPTGVTEFTGLSDVPSAYTGFGSYLVSVKSTADKLEFHYQIGTSPNNLIQLDSTGKLPAVDGSQLTNISSGSIGSITAYSILGNNTSVSAAPIQLTAIETKDLLNIQASDVSGLGSLATLSSIDNSHITASTITLAKLAGITANTLLGNNTGTTATPLTLSPSQVKSLLAIGASDLSSIANNTVLGNISGSSAAPIALTASNLSTLLSLGSLATLSSVPLTSIATIATGKVLGNVSGYTTTPTTLSASDLNTLLSLGPIAQLSNSGASVGYVPTYQVGGTITWANPTTITAGSITLADIATIANNTVLGNISGSTASPSAISIGTSPNNLVQLNGSGKLPAVDGSLLTNVSATIATGSITLADITTIATGTVLGNVSGSVASPSALTASNLSTLLSLGSLATLSSVPLTSIATIATGKVLGNVSGSTGTPTVLSASDLSTLLGLGPIANLSNSGASVGYVPTYQSGGTITWSNPTTITAGSITLADIATIANNTVLGNVSGGAASPIALTVSNLSTMLSLGSLATLSSVPLTSIATIATGKVLGNVSGSTGTPTVLSASDLSTLLSLGSLATLSSVPLTSIATIATGKVLGNVSGSTGTPTVLSASDLSTLLGLGPIANLSNSGASVGYVPTYQVGGTITWANPSTITAGSINLSDIATIANNTFLGNVSGSTASPLALTPSQVKTSLAIAAGDVSGLSALATLASSSTVGYVPTIQTGGSIAWAAQSGGSGGSGWSVASVQTSTFTPSTLTIYPVDTTSAAISVTLPSTSGGQYWFTDAGASSTTTGWYTHNLTLVPPTGYSIANKGANNSVVLNIGYGFIQLVLIGTNFQIISASTGL